MLHSCAYNRCLCCEKRNCLTLHMFILSTVIAGATLGGTIGGAIATITGTSVATGTAVGTLIGAGTTAAACTVQGTEAAARQLA